jgi:hypothetical protein
VEIETVIKNYRAFGRVECIIHAKFYDSLDFVVYCRLLNLHGHDIHILACVRNVSMIADRHDIVEATNSDNQRESTLDSTRISLSRMRQVFLMLTRSNMGVDN